ncbi:MAG: hypothetical protein ACOY9D_09255 [Pseudomonadota bacterium]
MSKGLGEDQSIKKVYRSVRNLPKDSSREEIRLALPGILELISTTQRQFLPELRMVIYEFGKQPNLLAALQDNYIAMPTSNYHQRYLVLQLMGELQNPLALPFLKDVVTAPLPPQTASAEGLSPRDDEATIQMKAIQGIGYIRDESGLPVRPALDALINIAQTHPERAVRVVAIDTYMWNHPDSREASANLKRALPEEYHPFIGRERFYRGAALESFSKHK